jgi:hypothetical protein
MTFAVVGNDAGGSELLIAFVQRHFGLASWKLYAFDSSPMYKIATKENLDIQVMDDGFNLDDVKFDAVLFATGWQEKPERIFIKYAKEKKIPTFAFLDHWSNYKERFDFPNEHWEENLPNYTVVTDQTALTMAKQLNLPNPIALPNYYIQSLVKSAPKPSKQITNQQTLLFLSEPTKRVAKEHFGFELHWGFTQYSALRLVCQNFHKFPCNNITIRLHPSEEIGEYISVLEEFPHINCTINAVKEHSLSQQIMDARVVMGFDSMALYIALHLGKPIISYLPSLNREFFVPIPPSHQVRHIDDISPHHFEPLGMYKEMLNLFNQVFCINFDMFLSYVKKPL